jgi:hypothetical protein
MNLLQKQRFPQALALPHIKSNPKKGMPQNKILTLINSSDGGIGGQYGVTFEREKGINREAGSPLPAGKQENEDQNPGRVCCGCRL